MKNRPSSHYLGQGTKKDHYNRLKARIVDCHNKIVSNPTSQAGKTNFAQTQIGRPSRLEQDSSRPMAVFGNWATADNQNKDYQA